MSIIRLLVLLMYACFVQFGSAVSVAQEKIPDIPNFWDKHTRYPQPDISGLKQLKFLTTTDFPPFNFIDREKRLSGFHVELAREICQVLELIQRCQIQAVPWEELIPMIEKGEGDAIIAGIAVSAEARKQLDFTHHYLQVPARFVARVNSGIGEPIYAGLFRRTTGVVAGSAHAAYFKSVFSNRRVVEYKSRDLALSALRKGQVDAVFSDALSLSFWLASPVSQDCCAFVDGAFQSRKHFGNGLSIAVKSGNSQLRDTLSFALAEINRNGKFAEFYRRYFPLGLF